MADICMRLDKQCPQKHNCLRMNASPTGYMDPKTGKFVGRQSYFAESPRKGDTCDYYWPMQKEVLNETQDQSRQGQR